jgi:NADH-quinone oxidoreductase subunit B
MGVTLPPAPYGAAGRSTVEGYDPKVHDRFFEQAQGELADKGFLVTSERTWSPGRAPAR